MNDSMEATMLKVSEVAAMMAVHKDTVHGWIDSGLLPAISLPGDKRKHRRVRRSDLADFITQLATEAKKAN